MKQRINSSLVVVIALLMTILMACGGGTTTTPAATLTVSPTTATATIGGAAIPLTATLSNSTAAINWTVSGGGTLSATTGASVNYTPPTTGAAGTATVTATSGTLSATSTITINAAPAAATLTVSPVATTTTVGGGAIAFTATLANSSASPNSITWAISGAGGGTLSTATGAAVSYTPPATGAGGAATLTASVAGLTATAAITVNAVTVPTLTVSPKTRTVTEGSAAVTFTAALTNSTDTISWALTGAGTIPANSTGTSVVYTPPTTGGASTATLTATAGALSDAASITVTAKPVATITVAGKVLNFDGSPAAGVNVQIDDAATALTTTATKGPVVTDGTGSFSIAGVQTPYTLSVIPPAGTSAPQSWTNVTRTDPTVVVTPFAGPANCTTQPAPGTINVTWSTPVAAGGQAQVTYVAPGINHLETSSNVVQFAAAGSTGVTIPVTFDPSICGTTVTGKVVYIEFDAANNIVRTGSQDATVLTGNAVPVSITQLTATTKSISGTVTFPSGTTTGSIDILAKVGEATFFFTPNLIPISSASPTYSFAAPEIPGVQFYTLAIVGGFGATAQWRYSEAISSLPATANLSLPNLGATSTPAGATGTNTTPTFTYTPVTDTNLYSTQLQGPGTQWIGNTNSTSMKIPALPAPARLAAGTAAAPNAFTWIYSASKVRVGGDSDTMLDGRQVKKQFFGANSISNPSVVSGGSVNVTPTTFTLP